MLLSGNKISGAVAQLGERLLCKQDVVGSIPSGSTTCAIRRIVACCRHIAVWRARNPEGIVAVRDDPADRAEVSSRDEGKKSFVKRFCGEHLACRLFCLTL
jgi:hypothetical protein